MDSVHLLSLYSLILLLIWDCTDGEESTIYSVARNHQMRIGTQKTRTTFDGFLKDDFERLSNLCKQVSNSPDPSTPLYVELIDSGSACLQYYNITIETKDTSVRGWNWGVAEVQGKEDGLSPCSTIRADMLRAYPFYSRRSRILSSWQTFLHSPPLARTKHLDH